MKIHLVWASVFLCAFDLFLVLMVCLFAPEELVITMFLVAGLLLPIVNVPLLLTVPESPGLIRAGRVLVWFQVAFIGLAILVGLFAMAAAK